MCTADQPDNNTCLCRCHRNIRHGACGAWRACTRSSLTAPRSWSGSMRGRRRRSPSTGVMATPTWTPRESSTMWVQEGSQTDISLLKWRRTSHPSFETLLSSAKYFPTRVRNQNASIRTPCGSSLHIFSCATCRDFSSVLPGNEDGVGHKARGDAFAPGNSSSSMSGEPPGQTDCGGE